MKSEAKQSRNASKSSKKASTTTKSDGKRSKTTDLLSRILTTRTTRKQKESQSESSEDSPPISVAPQLTSQQLTVGCISKGAHESWNASENRDDEANHDHGATGNQGGFIWEADALNRGCWQLSFANAKGQQGVVELLLEDDEARGQIPGQLALRAGQIEAGPVGVSVLDFSNDDGIECHIPSPSRMDVVDRSLADLCFSGSEAFPHCSPASSTVSRNTPSPLIPTENTSVRSSCNFGCSNHSGNGSIEGELDGTRSDEAVEEHQQDAHQRHASDENDTTTSPDSTQGSRSTQPSSQRRGRSRNRKNYRGTSQCEDQMTLGNTSSASASTSTMSSKTVRKALSYLIRKLHDEGDAKDETSVKLNMSSSESTSSKSSSTSAKSKRSAAKKWVSISTNGSTLSLRGRNGSKITLRPLKSTEKEVAAECRDSEARESATTETACSEACENKETAQTIGNLGYNALNSIEESGASSSSDGSETTETQTGLKPSLSMQPESYQASRHESSSTPKSPRFTEGRSHSLGGPQGRVHKSPRESAWAPESAHRSRGSARNVLVETDVLNTPVQKTNRDISEMEMGSMPLLSKRTFRQSPRADFAEMPSLLSPTSRRSELSVIHSESLESTTSSKSHNSGMVIIRSLSNLTPRRKSIKSPKVSTPSSKHEKIIRPTDSTKYESQLIPSLSMATTESVLSAVSSTKGKPPRPTRSNKTETPPSPPDDQIMAPIPDKIPPTPKSARIKLQIESSPRMSTPVPPMSDSHSHLQIQPSLSTKTPRASNRFRPELSVLPFMSEKQYGTSQAVTTLKSAGTPRVASTLKSSAGTPKSTAATPKSAPGTPQFFAVTPKSEGMPRATPKSAATPRSALRGANTPSGNISRFKSSLSNTSTPLARGAGDLRPSLSMTDNTPKVSNTSMFRALPSMSYKTAVTPRSYRSRFQFESNNGMAETPKAAAPGGIRMNMSMPETPKAASLGGLVITPCKSNASLGLRASSSSSEEACPSVSSSCGPQPKLKPSRSSVAHASTKHVTDPCNRAKVDEPSENVLPCGSNETSGATKTPLAQQQNTSDEMTGGLKPKSPTRGKQSKTRKKAISLLKEILNDETTGCEALTPRESRTRRKTISLLKEILDSEAADGENSAMRRTILS